MSPDTIPAGVVLITDDDPFTRTLLSDVVRPDGHTVLLASNAEQALDLLAHEKVDVALVDLVLPDMSGLALLDRIKNHDSGIEVIVCTASKDADSVVEALRGRAFDYLVKPVVPEVVQRAVNRALNSRRLLGENIKLRRALDLVQAAQRLLADTELAPLREHALDTLMHMTQATHGVLGSPDEEMQCRGWALEPAKAALAWSHRQGLAAPDARPCTAPPGDLGGPALALSLGPPGVVALLCRPSHAEDFGPQELEAAQFLARHIHLALHNHIRFATVADAARRDSLTGLLNAQVLQAAVVQAVARAGREDGHGAVVFMDLDGFKQVNDVHGHLMGSRVLVELAGILSRAVRDGDVVSRFGGDEFVVLLLNAPPDDAMRVAERLRHKVNEHTFLLREGLKVKVTVSVGVAVFPHDGENAKGLLSLADAALYAAKHAGKNCVKRAVAPPEP